MSARLSVFRSFALAAVFASSLGSIFASIGCGGDRRGGGNILIRRDAGSGEEDAAGSQDTGVPPNNNDSGVPPNNNDASGFMDAAPDSGLDAGFRDAATGMDAGFPDAEPPPVRVVTVRDLQDGTSPNHPPVDTRISVVNVVVTALQTTGQSAGSFWVQEPFGGPFSGILVFVPPPRVGVYSIVPGDRLTLTGLYKEYFDVTEIELETIDAQTAGAELQPAELSPSDLATGGTLGEAYEGVLVRVSSLQVLSENPDAPMDFGEFQVTGGLRIDDQLYRLSPRPVVGTFLSYVVGVHHHAFAEYKLLPRSVNDIGF